jgi:hypothetical protein
MHETGRKRLTSWKEIAAHVGRDVRTVLRWEKERGLPIYRVPGATGRIVFAYTDELNAWSRGEAPIAPEAPLAQPPASSGAEPAAVQRTADQAHVGRDGWRGRGAAIVGIAALVVLVLVGWLGTVSKASDRPLTARITTTGIVATSPDGAERWRYAFPRGETSIGAMGQEHPGEMAEGNDLLITTGYTTRGSDAVVRGGELLRFSMIGALKSAFTFEDRPRFKGTAYGPPWAITDYRVEGSGPAARVAVAAHHYEWWPSIVTVLDGRWSRRGTFVNAGWIERLHWMAPDRLVISGFSNAADGGMIALLDAQAMDGASPASRGSEFECLSCGRGSALRYVVMPRSEVNRASMSPFNRVVLMVKRDALIARTIEMPATSAVAAPADILYEFTPSLDLVRASYSDRYWEAHRELEAQGKIAHSRAQCPDRDGPREIRVWEPRTGWTTRPTAPSRARPSPAQSRP